MFFKICGEVLYRHAPRKKKYVRRNQSPSMNKALSKKIMKRAKLRNRFLKIRTEQNQTHTQKKQTLVYFY